MLKDRVIGTTFIISLISHGLFLGTPSFNINSPKTERPKEITFQIEIEKPFLLPKVERMGEEKKLKEVVSDSPKPEPEREVKEVVLEKAKPTKERVEVLKPADEAMLRYQDMVKQRIEEVRKYPEWAKEQGIEGVAHLEFVILSNGNSQEIKLIHSSGSKILDQEAIATIKRASPFPPFPKEIASSSIQMEVSLVFTLK
ncbi:energy transducer TonB [bacterium]|nr:energy transducer TonB [bacterium]MBU4561003.1 energy transducer TonB [bacterium]MCG2675825.1 energy transducer TonB [bacterium]MCG2677204.1 energy transducer TonB [bacterium]